MKLIADLLYDSLFYFFPTFWNVSDLVNHLSSLFSHFAIGETYKLCIVIYILFRILSHKIAISFIRIVGYVILTSDNKVLFKLHLVLCSCLCRWFNNVWGRCWGRLCMMCRDEHVSKEYCTCWLGISFFCKSVLQKFRRDNTHPIIKPLKI